MMGYTVMKPSKDLDLYVTWSSYSEKLVAIGDREWMIPYLYEQDDRKPDRIPQSERPEVRLDRVDDAGTSALWPSRTNPFGGWNDEGWIYQQKGILPRARLLDLANRILEADTFDVDVSDLLELFDDPDLDA